MGWLLVEPILGYQSAFRAGVFCGGWRLDGMEAQSHRCGRPQWDRIVRMSGYVHARSVVACGLDGQTGELFERLTPDPTEIAGWVRSCPVRWR